MRITGVKSNYELVRHLAKNQRLNYHICADSAGVWKILAVAAALEQNSMLDRIEYILRRLEEISGKYEADYEEKFHDGRKLHYNWLIPKVEEVLTPSQTNGRHVDVLSFPDLDLEKTVVLTSILRENQRVDLRTSVWMMGRMLKLSGFLFENGIEVSFSLDRFLLEPEKHRLILLDWTDAKIGEEISEAKVCYHLKVMAEGILTLLGAEQKDGVWKYEYELQENEERYIRCLNRIYNGKFSMNAFDAHEKFYDIVDDIWGIKYHPFTAHEK